MTRLVPASAIELGDGQRLAGQSEVARRVWQAASAYRLRIDPIPAVFDLSGRAAGMYVVRSGDRWFRFNPWIFARYFEENLRDTVAHEVAHYVVDLRFGRRSVKPHGPRWREVMKEFGVAPVVRHDFDLEGLPMRRQRQYAYRCGCRNHLLSAVRHNRIVARRAVYRCRKCGEEIRAGSIAVESGCGRSSGREMSR